MTFEEIIALIESNLDREVNLFNREFESVLSKIQKNLEIRAIENYSDPLEFDFVFQRVLQDSGYYSLVNKFIDESYDKSYDEIKALFELSGLSATYTQDDLNKIQAIKEIDLNFFAQVGNDAANTMKKDLYKYSISNLSTEEMIDNIRVSLEGTNLSRYSKTYADTLISNFNQSVIDLKSQDVEDEVYIYRGVKDKSTRKFCSCLLSQNKYYSKKDAEKIKNDKRREYNCRHLIVPVSRQYATDRGYKEGVFSC